MASLPQKTVQHFTHDHPLTEVDARTEFVCDGCRTLGVGTRYGCESCDFDLHDHCATCPLELSSFMHEHDLKLVVSKPQATSLQNERFCDLCGDPVQGIFYQCRLCEFDVHPLCTKLPEYVRHVMHKEHPLRLQGSVPGRCMVCKDTCTSWHYRCGICCFDLHLECVLAPCEEEATSTSTSRSLKSPVPPPSPSAPSLCNAYGYGAIPPPPSPSAPSLYNAYGYGAIPPPPSSSASPYYVYGYGAIQPPPPPPSSPYYAYGYGAIPPPPYSAYGYRPSAHGYGTPSSSGGYHLNNHPQCSSQVQGVGGKNRKNMYAIAGQLALGVVTNVVFGTIFW
ncbi:DC1 - like 10 [Theobroma cacao]|nr:DC1 - like 10 [Theobroma cacao]